MAGPDRFELPTAGFEDQNSSAELRTVMGCPTGIDPVLPVSQTSVQATTLRTPLVGDEGVEPSNGGIKIRCLDQLG
jgi:hypothetical protein